MVEMCQIVGYRDQLVTLLLLLAENVLNIILVHFQDGYALIVLVLILVTAVVSSALLIDPSKAIVEETSHQSIDLDKVCPILTSFFDFSYRTCYYVNPPELISSIGMQ